MDREHDGEQGTSKDIQELARCIKGGSKSECKMLGWNQWHLAFDRYAIAAAACGQWDMGAAIMHRQIVLQALAEA